MTSLWNGHKVIKQLKSACTIKKIMPLDSSLGRINTGLEVTLKQTLTGD